MGLGMFSKGGFSVDTRVAMYFPGDMPSCGARMLYSSCDMLGNNAVFLALSCSVEALENMLNRKEKMLDELNQCTDETETASVGVHIYVQANFFPTISPKLPFQRSLTPTLPRTRPLLERHEIVISRRIIAESEIVGLLRVCVTCV